MRRLSRLVALLLLRPLRREAFRVTVSVLGVALGVAVPVAIRLANESVLSAFARGVDAVAGRAGLTVHAGELGVPEELFSLLRADPAVAHASPLIQVLAPVQGIAGEFLLVLGVDLLSERSFRDYRLADPPPGLDPLALLVEPDAILVAARFAEAHGLAAGGRLTLLTPAGPRPFRIRGLLTAEGPAVALDGRLALLDIATAQVAFQKLGRLDRVDLLLKPGADPAVVAARLRARLPAGLAVERPAARTAQVEEMLASFRLNLTVLSLIALLTGCFLVYNTMGIAVLRRRRSLGVLRALGFSRRQVATLVVGEAALLGAAGGLLGTLAGGALSRAAVVAMARTVSQLYAFVRPEPPALTAGTVVLGLLAGLVAALLAAVGPARLAVAVSPREAMTSAPLLRRPRTAAAAAGGVALLGLGLLLARPGPIGTPPVGGYLAALAVVLGGALLTPALLLALAAAGRILLPALPVPASLALLSLRRAVRRNAVAASAMMVGLAMLVSVSTMIRSFRATVEAWIGQSVRADFVLSPAGRYLKGADGRLPASLLQTLAAVEGVEALDPFRGIRVEDGRGGRFLLASGDFAVHARYGRLLMVDGDAPAILRAAREAGAVVISETFALRYGVRVGEQISLPTPRGPVPVPVAGIFYDYTTEGGLVVMDRSLFTRLIGDPFLSSIGIYLTPDADPGVVRRRILTAVPGREDLLLLANRALKARVLEIFDQTFAITYALEFIALLVAALGILNAQMAAVLERQRELGILRALGLSRRQVLATVLAEAGLLGIAANLLGAAVGLALSMILIYVINFQSFGWSIQFHFPTREMVQVTALALATALAAGALPASVAAALPPVDALRHE
jgi:putative ABC transport system permease protein